MCPNNLLENSFGHSPISSVDMGSISGLECLSSSGLECLPTSGLECLLTSGLECLLTSGLECLLTSGLECLLTSDLECLSLYRFPLLGNNSVRSSLGDEELREELFTPGSVLCQRKLGDYFLRELTVCRQETR
jgi:hypothetical protein